MEKPYYRGTCSGKSSEIEAIDSPPSLKILTVGVSSEHSLKRGLRNIFQQETATKPSLQFLKRAKSTKQDQSSFSNISIKNLQYF